MSGNNYFQAQDDILKTMCMEILLSMKKTAVENLVRVETNLKYYQDRYKYEKPAIEEKNIWHNNLMLEKKIKRAIYVYDTMLKEKNS